MATKSDNKTQPTPASADDFVAAIEDPIKRADCVALMDMMQRLSGESPRMWGSTMIGFGHYHYKYDSGREGDFFRVGFSPRKDNLTLYIVPGFAEYENLLAQLGKHSTGKSCLYVRKLSDIDVSVLEQLIDRSLETMAERYPE